jgi:hypothetical protein
VRFAIVGMMVVAVVAMVSALVLLAHVDEGRRAVQQLLQVKTELRATFDELGRIPATAWVTKSAPADAPSSQEDSAEFVPFCPVGPSPVASPDAHSSPHFALASFGMNTPAFDTASAKFCISGASLCSGMLGMRS